MSPFDGKGLVSYFQHHPERAEVTSDVREVEIFLVDAGSHLLSRSRSALTLDWGRH